MGYFFNPMVLPIRLIETRVVFELYLSIKLLNSAYRLIETRVVFEFVLASTVDTMPSRLIETRVVFEFKFVYFYLTFFI